MQILSSCHSNSNSSSTSCGCDQIYIKDLKRNFSQPCDLNCEWGFRYQVMCHCFIFWLGVCSNLWFVSSVCINLNYCRTYIRQPMEHQRSRDLEATGNECWQIFKFYYQTPERCLTISLTTIDSFIDSLLSSFVLHS